MSPERSKVVERAKKAPAARFHSLAHYLDEAALKRAFASIRKDAATGVDGVSKEEYAEQLDETIRDLHQRLRTQRYRHQPIRRVHIPKGPGSRETRPIGISTIEDKIVQGALREVLEAIYEQDFLPCSFGFRPERSAHDALGVLHRMFYRERVQWVLEADIRSFFDSIDRKKLMELLQLRIADGSILRLVGKCLHVGVLDGEEFTEPEDGTAQGSIISPLLSILLLESVSQRELGPGHEDQGRASARPCSGSASGAGATGISRVRSSTPRSPGSCMGTPNTSVSTATPDALARSCTTSNASGSSGCSAGVSGSPYAGSGSTPIWRSSRFPHLGSANRSGARQLHETPPAEEPYGGNLHVRI